MKRDRGNTPSDQPAANAPPERGHAGSAVAKAAADAVIMASAGIQATESIARRAGLTKRNGKIGVRGVWKVTVHPLETARTVLDATADELRSRRVEDRTRPVDDQPPA